MFVYKNNTSYIFKFWIKFNKLLSRDDSHRDNDMPSAFDTLKFRVSTKLEMHRFQLYPRWSNEVASVDSKSRKLVFQPTTYRRVDAERASMQSTESRIRRRSNNLEDGCASPSQVAFRGTRTKVDKQPLGEVHSCADASGIGYR